MHTHKEGANYMDIIQKRKLALASMMFPMESKPDINSACIEVESASLLEINDKSTPFFGGCMEEDMLQEFGVEQNSDSTKATKTLS